MCDDLSKGNFTMLRNERLMSSLRHSSGMHQAKTSKVGLHSIYMYVACTNPILYNYVYVTVEAHVWYMYLSLCNNCTHRFQCYMSIRICGVHVCTSLVSELYVPCLCVLYNLHLSRGACCPLAMNRCNRNQASYYLHKLFPWE